MQINRIGEVFRAFLILGLTAFGGPIAHLAHFRRELIDRRQWIDEAAYAELVAYCQFMPGPTSSQVGFLMGWHRAGLSGALAAWCAFTLPSAIVLTAAAVFCGTIDTTGAWLLGMKAAVLAVVAQAVLAMARSLCPDAPRATIAVGVSAVCLLTSQAWIPMAILVPAGLAGILIGRNKSVVATKNTQATEVPSLRVSISCLGILPALTFLMSYAVVAGWGSLAVLAAACFQAGGLVFGGGHVVLPMLREPLVQGGLISDPVFLAGYGAAQAVPGPLFTVAAWMGAQVGGIPAAALALVAIFAPGLLLALGCLRFYRRALASSWARHAVGGLNAGVVGLLGAALWSPIGTEAIHGPVSVVLALVAFLALEAWRVPAWAVVAGCCLASMLIGTN